MIVLEIHVVKFNTAQMCLVLYSDAGYNIFLVASSCQRFCCKEWIHSHPVIPKPRQFCSCQSRRLHLRHERWAWSQMPAGARCCGYATDWRAMATPNSESEYNALHVVGCVVMSAVVKRLQISWVEVPRAASGVTASSDMQWPFVVTTIVIVADVLVEKYNLRHFKTEFNKNRFFSQQTNFMLILFHENIDLRDLSSVKTGRNSANVSSEVTSEWPDSQVLTLPGSPDLSADAGCVVIIARVLCRTPSCAIQSTSHNTAPHTRNFLTPYLWQSDPDIVIVVVVVAR